MDYNLHLVSICEVKCYVHSIFTPVCYISLCINLSSFIPCNSKPHRDHGNDQNHKKQESKQKLG